MQNSKFSDRNMEGVYFSLLPAIAIQIPDEH
jgi:hypothetical protein